MDEDDTKVTKADQYRHPDGTVEVVYALEEGTVLTFREYPSEEAFQTALEAAEYLGEHPGVAELPGPTDGPTEGTDAVEE